MFSNQRAMLELLSLWRRYTENPDEAFPWGLARWKSFFAQLRTIRLWDETDRVSAALIEDWGERLGLGQEQVPFEAELWYFHQPDKRDSAERDVKEIIERSGGSIGRRCVIDEIEYHAITGYLPSHAIRDAYRGAVVVPVPLRSSCRETPWRQTERGIACKAAPLPREDLQPVVAILDGMPIENHPLLDGRLVVDDPDQWAQEVRVADRVHGTAMASLIVHGDLETGQSPLNRRVYIRPILRPDRREWTPRAESVPEDLLFVDLLHRSIVRLFENRATGDERIYAINLSVGDRCRVFARNLSPCARLLDWLAWRYQVLFLISAGNQARM